MTITQEEIEQEITRLSSFVNRQYLSSQKLINKMKPSLKRKGLELEIAALKAQLVLVNRLIERKQKEER